MALTNALLKSLEIDGDKRDTIMAAHQDTLAEIKAERDGLRDKAARVPELEKQVEELRAKIPTEDWKARYEAEHEALQAKVSEHEKYVAEVERSRADAEKRDLYKAMLLEQGIDPKRVDTVVKVTDLSGVIVKEGQLENREELAAKAAEEWKDFVVKSITKGASVDNPHGGGSAKTKDEIMAITDTAARQAAIAENPELFGLA